MKRNAQLAVELCTGRINLSDLFRQRSSSSLYGLVFWSACTNVIHNVLVNCPKSINEVTLICGNFSGIGTLKTSWKVTIGKRSIFIQFFFNHQQWGIWSTIYIFSDFWETYEIEGTLECGWRTGNTFSKIPHGLCSDGVPQRESPFHGPPGCTLTMK